MPCVCGMFTASMIRSFSVQRCGSCFSCMLSLDILVITVKKAVRSPEVWCGRSVQPSSLEWQPLYFRCLSVQWASCRAKPSSLTTAARIWRWKMLSCWNVIIRSSRNLPQMEKRSRVSRSVYIQRQILISTA